MNNIIRFTLGVWVLLLIAGCGGKASWDEQELQEVSHRLLSYDVEAVWTIDPAASDAASRIGLRLQKLDGTAIERYKINHEKILHLMIVSQDLSYFRHVHPAYVGEGKFEIDNAFPSGGAYKLIADFWPENGDSMVKSDWVRLPGAEAPKMPLVPDARKIQVVDGVRIQLDMDRSTAKEEAELTFTLADAASGEAITDLQPYLGAVGHVVVLSEGGEKYIHVHAEDGQGAGPKAIFEATFPSAGLYKIWAQFQRNGQVLTAEYVVDISSRAAAD